MLNINYLFTQAFALVFYTVTSGAHSYKTFYGELVKTLVAIQLAYSWFTSVVIHANSHLTNLILMGKFSAFFPCEQDIHHARSGETCCPLVTMIGNSVGNSTSMERPLVVYTHITHTFILSWHKQQAYLGKERKTKHWTQWLMSLIMLMQHLLHLSPYLLAHRPRCHEDVQMQVGG